MANANDTATREILLNLRKSYVVASKDSPEQIEARRAELITDINHFNQLTIF